jgi:hypothetical protein
MTKWKNININKDIINLSNMPIIGIMLYGKEYNFMLDTGANECLIDIDVVKELGSHIKMEDTDEEIRGIDNNIEIKKVTLTMDIANCSEEISFSVLSLDNINEFFEDYNIVISGIIGTKFFMNFNWILDFHELKVHYPLTINN